MSNFGKYPQHPDANIPLTGIIAWFARNGVAANLLGLFLDANTWYYELCLSLNKKMTNFISSISPLIFCLITWCG